RLLMVGFLEPLQELFSDEVKKVFWMLREWAEDEHKWQGYPASVFGQREWNTRALAERAVGWVAYEALNIRTTTFWNAEELCDKAAHPLVFRKVGRSPLDVLLTHPSHQAWAKAWRDEFQAIQAKQADLMRCVYGNPYRPVTLNSS